MGKGKGLSTKRIVWISITEVLVFIILVLALVSLVKCVLEKGKSVTRYPNKMKLVHIKATD